MNLKRYLFVRLTKNQHDRLKDDAEAKGYKTVSSYIRSIALGRDSSFEEKFEEVYQKLVLEK